MRRMTRRGMTIDPATKVAVMGLGALAGTLAMGNYVANKLIDEKAVQAQREFYRGFRDIDEGTYGASSTNLLQEAALRHPYQRGQIVRIYKLPEEKYTQPINGCGYALIGTFEVEWDTGAREKVPGHVSFLKSGWC